MMHQTPNQPEGAFCAFCNAPWSASMLAALDAATLPGGCACCRDTSVPAPQQNRVRASQARDIACEACGKMIFRALPETHNT